MDLNTQRMRGDAIVRGDAIMRGVRIVRIVALCVLVALAGCIYYLQVTKPHAMLYIETPQLVWHGDDLKMFFMKDGSQLHPTRRAAIMSAALYVDILVDVATTTHTTPRTTCPFEPPSLQTTNAYTIINNPNVADLSYTYVKTIRRYERDGRLVHTVLDGYGHHGGDGCDASSSSSGGSLPPSCHNSEVANRVANLVLDTAAPGDYAIVNYHLPSVGNVSDVVYMRDSNTLFCCTIRIDEDALSTMSTTKSHAKRPMQHVGWITGAYVLIFGVLFVYPAPLVAHTRLMDVYPDYPLLYGLFYLTFGAAICAIIVLHATEATRNNYVEVNRDMHKDIVVTRVIGVTISAMILSFAFFSMKNKTDMRDRSFIIPIIVLAVALAIGSLFDLFGIHYKTPDINHLDYHDDADNRSYMLQQAVHVLITSSIIILLWTMSVNLLRYALVV